MLYLGDKMKISSLLAAVGVSFLIAAPGCRIVHSHRVHHPVERRVVHGDYRAGFDVVPFSCYKDGRSFRILGYKPYTNERVSIHEDVRRSNRRILNEVKSDLEWIIDLNKKRPRGHSGKAVYVTGIYEDNNIGWDRLDLETINIDGDLYFTDPIGDSRIYYDHEFEFWMTPWWRSGIYVYYPHDFRPWWHNHDRRPYFGERSTPDEKVKRGRSITRSPLPRGIQDETRERSPKQEKRDPPEIRTRERSPRQEKRDPPETRTRERTETKKKAEPERTRQRTIRR